MTGSPLAYTTPGDIARHGEFIDFVALGHLPTGKMPRFRVVTVEQGAARPPRFSDGG